MANQNDQISCPRCGKALEDRKGCPHCGYHGYIPMSDAQIKRTKLILYPIAVAVAAVVILILYLAGKA